MLYYKVIYMENRESREIPNQEIAQKWLDAIIKDREGFTTKTPLTVYVSYVVLALFKKWCKENNKKVSNVIEQLILNFLYQQGVKSAKSNNE